MSKNKLTIKQRIALNLWSHYVSNQAKIPQLSQLFWESTLRCNLNCRHCGSDCHSTAGLKDMPFVDFLKVIDSITPHVNPNKVLIIISGGEPLVRKDLEQCGLELYRRGFPWGMVSNGLFMTPARFNSLMDSGLRSLTISLDGFEEDHNWMRGNSKSFTMAVNAIKMALAEPNLAFDVVTCVNPRNFPYLDKMADFLVSIGLKRWRLFTVFPSGRGKDPELQITDEQFRGLMDFIVRMRESNKIHASYGCEGFLGAYEGRVRDHFYTCQAGLSVASVLCDGSISACTSIRSDFHQGNIYQDDFWYVWENRFEPYRNRAWMRKDGCADCKMWKYCKGGGMHLRDSEGSLSVCHYKRLYHDE